MLRGEPPPDRSKRDGTPGSIAATLSGSAATESEKTAVSVASGRHSAPDDVQEHTELALTFWERFSYATLRLSMAALLAGLGVRGAYRFSRFFGFLEYLVNHKRRRRFREELAEVFPAGLRPSLARRHCREYFMHDRCNRTFYLLFEPLGRERILGLFTFENLELLQRALDHGAGIYVAMSHFGPYHIGAMYMTLLGYKTAGVRDRNEGGLRRYFQRRFDRKYPQFQRMKVFFSDASPRVIYQALKSGYLLGSAMDARRMRRPNQKTHDVMFLGEPRPFLTGPLRVAIRCRVPVIQTFVVPEADFRFRVRLFGPLYWPGDAGTEEELVDRAMQQYASRVEEHLKAWPYHTSRL